MNPDRTAPSAAPVIPDHEMLRRIGGGSYGEVWLARNVIGAYRAVKIVYRSTFCDARPFEREFNGIQKYEPISRSHPGLVQVLQVGRNNDAGYFYYVMELADDQCGAQTFHPDSYSARTLNREVLARGRLEFQESIELGIALADALAHLHQHGLIHRDIKPSNIIFVNGRPKLADIGLVISVGESGTMVGTEGFIPPEGPTSPQSDIYSLGKVLYEMSTGNDRHSFPELPDAINDGSEAEQFSELNEIITKACAPFPANRYQNADVLRSDLDVLRAGKSVRRLRVLERRLSLFTRLGIVGGALILLAVGVIYAVNAAREREQKLRTLAYIEGGKRMIEDRNYHAALPYFVQALDLSKKDPAAADLQRLRIGMLLRQSVQLLQAWTNSGPVKNVRFSADGKRLLISQHSSVQIWDIASRQLLSPSFKVSSAIETATFSPDESRVLIAAGKSVYLYDAASGERVGQGRPGGNVTAAMFSSDGKFIAVAHDWQGSIYTTDSLDGAPILELTGHTNVVEDICFSPAGDRLLTASHDGTARFWDARSGKEIGPPLDHESWVYHAAFSSDGTHALTTSLDRSVRVWDVQTHRLATRPMDHRDGVRRASFSPDGTMIVSGGADETVVLWDSQTGHPLQPKLNHDKPVTDVVFDSSGRRLATADHGGTVKIWDIEPLPATDIGDSHFSGDSARYVTISNGSFSVYDSRTKVVIANAHALDRSVTSTFFSAAADRLIFVSKGSIQTFACVADAQSGYRPQPWFSLGPIASLELSPDGKFAFVVDSGDSTFSLWDLPAGAPIHTSLRAAFKNPKASFSADGKTAALFAGKKVQLWNVLTGKTIGGIFNHNYDVIRARLTKDGQRLLTASGDATYSACSAQVWDVRTTNIIAGPFGHDDGVIEARFNADETLVLTGSDDHYARVWNVTTKQLDMRTVRHGAAVVLARFSADGSAILTVGNDETIRLIETATGYPLAGPINFEAYVSNAGFFPDGRSVWVRLRDRTFVINLERTHYSLTQLKELIGALGTSQIMRGRGGWSADEADGWRGALGRVVEPSRLQSCLDDLPRWHERQAEAFERKKNWSAARFHYRRLQQLAPTNSSYSLRLAAVERQLGGSRRTP